MFTGRLIISVEPDNQTHKSIGMTLEISLEIRSSITVSYNLIHCIRNERGETEKCKGYQDARCLREGFALMKPE